MTPKTPEEVVAHFAAEAPPLTPALSDVEIDSHWALQFLADDELASALAAMEKNIAAYYRCKARVIELCCARLAGK